MTGYKNQIVKALGVAMMMAAPAAADQFGFGISFSQARGGSQVGLGFNWGARPVVAAPVVARPVVTQRVWVPTVQTVYRDVPVLDARGRVVSYRKVAEIVKSGHWANVSQPVAVRSVNIPDRVERQNVGHIEMRDRDNHRSSGMSHWRYPANNAGRDGGHRR